MGMRNPDILGYSHKGRRGWERKLNDGDSVILSSSLFDGINRHLRRWRIILSRPIAIASPA